MKGEKAKAIRQMSFIGEPFKWNFFYMNRVSNFPDSSLLPRKA